MTPPKLNSDLASASLYMDGEELAPLCWSAVARIEELEDALETLMAACARLTASARSGSDEDRKGSVKAFDEAIAEAKPLLRQRVCT